MTWSKSGMAMKKHIGLAVLLIVSALALTACGDDDEPKEKVTASATYSMAFSQDLLDACNVFITYKADNGRDIREQITTTWWTKTVTSDEFPAEFGVMYEFFTKINSELTKDSYNLFSELNFTVKTSKGALYSNKVTIFDINNVAKDKLISTLDRYSGKSTGFRVTENGIVSEANNLDYD